MSVFSAFAAFYHNPASDVHKCLDIRMPRIVCFLQTEEQDENYL